MNCLTDPERTIVELFRVSVFGVLVNPVPGVVYDAAWSTATWGVDVRRQAFESAFAIVIVSIDTVDFAVTLLPLWFVAYNAAVENGSAPLQLPCPCDGF